MDYLKYFRYLLKHKWYVLVECARQGIIWRGLVHDMDKFRPKLFIPYVQYYYRGRHEKDKEAFDAAWDRHKKRNKHHWQHWLSPDGTPQEMPYHYNVEMFCDWVGVGKARGKCLPGDDRYDEVKCFYLRKKNEEDEKKRMKLHPNIQK